MIHLKAWREYAGYPTQSDFCRALDAASAGIGQSAVSYYESGSLQPKLETAQKLTAVINRGLTAQGKPPITAGDLLHAPAALVTLEPSAEAAPC